MVKLLIYVLYKTGVIASCLYLASRVEQKKQQIMNEYINKSFCKISLFILNLCRYSMIIFAILQLLKVLEAAGVSQVKQLVWIGYDTKSIFESMIQISQLYEWTSMLTIINWQKGLDLTQALIEMHDDEGKL